MGLPFPTQNQRVITVPISPSVSTDGVFTGAGTFQFAAIPLGQPNINALLVPTYIHYACVWIRQGGAACTMDVQLQWQFRNAAHANVGAAINTFGLVVNQNAAPNGGVLSHAMFVPHFPHAVVRAVPGGVGATEVCLQAVVAIAGLPTAFFAIGYGIDITNTGVTGDIGGNGLISVNPNNVNQF